MKGIKKVENSIGYIVWQDAAYTFKTRLPAAPPLVKVTIGLIVSVRGGMVNIATNMGYDPVTGRVAPTDGLLIPERAVVAFGHWGRLQNYVS